MNKEQLSLASEITQLKELLANLPNENLIERISLEARLKIVSQKLATSSQHMDSK